jgi:microsomal dipeptidase-like Zn-dependent dipeptidase
MHLLDLHAHFPMHTPLPSAPPGGAASWKKLLYETVNARFNYEDGVPRMRADRVAAGVFSGFASVLHDPEDEFLVRRTDPRPQAFLHLKTQAGNAEIEARSIGLAVARDVATVERCLESGERFLIHCMEGGFGCGGDPGNIEKLRELGVAYLILAHLTYRNIATCANSIPHLPNAVFHLLNPQRSSEGLTPLGRSLAEAAMASGIILDITHATDRAQDELFSLAASYVPRAPLISSHTGVRGIAEYEVNLSDRAIERVADSGGVVGVIVYPYWLQRSSEKADDLALVVDTIEYIARKTSFDHVAIGTDMDGFIQPVRECPNYALVGLIEDRIRCEYSKEVADKILWANALRVLRSGWGVRRSPSRR